MSGGGAVASVPVWRRRLVGSYLELRTIPVLLWSFAGVTLGTALAGRDGAVAVGWFVAAAAVGALLQGVVAHTVNEVADWRSGTDRDPAPRMLSGGSKVLRAGLLGERELVWLGVAGAAAATGLGLFVAAERGWWLLLFGGVGLVGAVVYTLPPLALAYSPFAGESVAFLCVWCCVVGAFAVQAGAVGWAAVLVGAAHAAYCVSMLMLHHYADRGPDSRAVPRKVTSVVFLGDSARSYGVGWAVVSAVLAAVSCVAVDVRLVPVAAAAVVAAVMHVRVDPGDAASVTRAELVVIGAGIGGALVASVLMVPSLVWVVAVPAVLVPFELAVERRWIAPAVQGGPNDPHGGPPAAGPQSPSRA